jgi:hypothetical protein
MHIIIWVCIFYKGEVKGNVLHLGVLYVYSEQSAVLMQCL